MSRASSRWPSSLIARASLVSSVAHRVATALEHERWDDERARRTFYDVIAEQSADSPLRAKLFDWLDRTPETWSRFKRDTLREAARDHARHVFLLREAASAFDAFAYAQRFALVASAIGALWDAPKVETCA